MGTAHRLFVLLGVGVMILGTSTIAQRSSTVPQPQASRLAPIGPATPNRGAIVERPAGVMPAVPAGFTVSVYAELQAPRMMVYAPNGDLFVSSPATNSITVLRDANNDATPPRYNQAAAEQAWKRTVAWFNKYVRTTS